MAFPERFLEELVSRNDIVDVVGSYVQLTKKSGNNLFGLCPFHSEKTPSFSVSRDKQIYHCFGCGKGGGVINFIMEIENLSFPDAVQFLAKRVGMTVPDDDTPAEIRGRRETLLNLNRDAAKFFYSQLSKPEGQTAVEYIKNRGISPAIAKRFGLGAAPDSWTALTDAMIQKGYSQFDLYDAGLVKKGKKGGVYDTFRNRLMFPIIDVRGNVIGFSGRILGDGEPKYLNSPDTLVFNKSRNLFAINLAKKTKHDMFILAEGNVDVVSLHQAGFDSAVASLGTSLTPDQARMISRYTSNVVIAYDSDNAGVKAAKRAIELLEKTGLNVKVLKMEGAKDPDEFIKKRGADAFAVLLDKSENHIDYRLLSVKEKYDLETDDGKLGFLSEAAELLSELTSPIEREIYGTKAAGYAGVSPEAMKSEISRVRRLKIASARKRQERKDLRPSETLQPKERSIRYKDAVSAAAEEGVIRLIIQDQTIIPKDEELNESDFTSEFLGKLFRIIKQKNQQGQNISITLLSAELQPEEMSHLTEILQKPLSMTNSETAMQDYIEKIKTEKLKKAAKNDIMAVFEKYRETKMGTEDKNGQ